MTLFLMFFNAFGGTWNLGLWGLDNDRLINLIFGVLACLMSFVLFFVWRDERNSR